MRVFAKDDVSVLGMSEHYQKLSKFFSDFSQFARYGAVLYDHGGLFSALTELLTLEVVLPRHCPTNTIT